MFAFRGLAGGERGDLAREEVFEVTKAQLDRREGAQRAGRGKRRRRKGGHVG